MPATKPVLPVLQSNQYATGLIYFATCYEGTGVVLHDSSSTADHGTIGAGVWGTGQFGGADLAIGGDVTKAVVLTPAPEFEQTGNFSVSCWVKLTANTSQAFVSTFRSSAVGGFLWGWVLGCDDGNSGKLKWFTANNSTTGDTSLSTGVVSTGAWHNIISTWTASGTFASLYVDGALDSVASAQQQPAYTTNTPHSMLGGLVLSDGTTKIQPILGQLDAIALYNYVLPLSGGAKDSVAGIFADPFRGVRAAAVVAGSGFGYSDIEEGNGLLGG